MPNKGVPIEFENKYEEKVKKYECTFQTQETGDILLFGRTIHFTFNLPVTQEKGSM